jgi:hypothetical protein
MKIKIINIAIVKNIDMTIKHAVMMIKEMILITKSVIV